MEQILSWKELIVFLAVLLIGYYAIILIIFYKRELAQLFSSGLRTDTKEKNNKTTIDSDKMELPDDNSLFNIAYDLMEDIKPVVNAAMHHQLERDSVLEALQIRIQKYPRLKGTAFQSAVSNHIQQELETRVGVSLSKEDINHIWK